MANHGDTRSAVKTVSMGDGCLQMDAASLADVDLGRPSRPIRLLFNVPSPLSHGGVATHDPTLERGLRKLAEVHTYLYSSRSDDEGMTRKVIGRSVDLARLRSLCRKLRPDLIHHNSSFDLRAILRDAPLMLLAKREGLPVFLKLHGSDPETLSASRGLVGRACRVVVGGADRIGVLSEAEKQEFEDAFPFVRGKVCVVKNAVGSEFARVEREETERPTILFLSRFVKEKGPFDLLRAVPLVLRAEPSAQFLFVGDGEDAATFDHEVGCMGLTRAVHRFPHVVNRETVAFYGKAWVFAFPTHFPEGMPMVIGEAMAAGMPIVSSPTRFSRSYMVEGVHVLTCGAGDPECLAASILRLCRDDELRKRMSGSNRKLALENFSVDRVAREYLDIYRSILGDHTAGLQGLEKFAPSA
jgi:glycosyltransferase involved in cell wall biosynthesis